MRWTFLTLLIGLSALIVGCNTSPPANKSGDSSKKGDDEIKQAFGSLQAAIKAKDADKVWDLLAKDSQQDTEREAKSVKEAFAKFSNDEKNAYEKKTALSAKDIAELNGKAYVKSKMFFVGDVDELPDSKLDKVVLSGDSGTVHYTEEKGEKEKLAVVREQGQWKFALTIPKAILK